MLLGTRKHTVGARRRFVVDYSEWLDDGFVPVSFTAVSDSTTLTVDGVVINPTQTCVFFTNDGELDEYATVTLTMTDSRDQIKIDTVAFDVIAP